ncbi:hypothetical protein Ahy_A02g008305 [Arachis hypogaea]|uniref:PB1-like domain-containing protein n=1 Tax=Arachis hypogaea TaxID=3818 RepID=A0A445EEF6_ARAHY|nr:hypothetical protein Ahy_A02g008305 [Arachis hypogaea]
MEGPPMTFVFHHGGLFKKNVEGDMIYEPDNTEVLIGGEGDTLDVFFVKGYYKELGYIEARKCWWKDPGVLLSSGLRRLVTDAYLLAMRKNCRRNQHPCIVDNMENDLVNVKAESFKQKKSSQAKKCSSQPAKMPTTMVPQFKKQTSQPNRPTS